ncbi:hypothetical protein [Chryseobacterium sp. C3]|uniref:hypothetical protein n=1 Tax=Chryseobacterium sp. C3 TaxID=2761532 RepID=UPI001624D698|nr:hypothetical protein [Chryseobacterium sp. C3]
MITDEYFIAESYMTVKMVKEVMAEFTWPVTYSVEKYNEYHISLKFPLCEIDLYNVPEDGVSVSFLTYDGGKTLNADEIDIIGFIDNHDPKRDYAIEYGTGANNEDNTKKSVRNNIKWLQQYHLGFIMGTDYSWITKYLASKK